MSATAEPEWTGYNGARRSRAPLAFSLGCLYLALLSFPGLVPLPGGATLGMVVMLAATPVWYATARARGAPFDLVASRATTIVLAAAGFLIFWSCLSVIGIEAPLRASRYFATLISAFAIYFLVRATLTRTRLALYIDILAGALAATCLLSLLAYRIDGLQHAIFGDTDRAAGLFKNPNQFGMAISTSLPAALALFLSERRRRVVRGLCIFLLILGLLASGSKTNLLLALGSIVIVLFSHALIANSRLRRMKMLALYFVGIVVIVALGVVALGVLNPRALRILTVFFSSEGEVASLMTRGFLWTYSVEQFLADPFFGQGAGQQIDVFYREADVAHSHNVLLDYMRSLGAPGLAGVISMLGAVVAICLVTILALLNSQMAPVSGRMLCLGLSVSCLSYIAANMSSDSFGPSTSSFFWVFTYLTFASRRLLIADGAESATPAGIFTRLVPEG